MRASVIWCGLVSVLLSGCDEPTDGADTGAEADGGAADGGSDSGSDCDAPSDWYFDADGDSYGDLALHLSACAAPAGYVADAGDCDDIAAATHPGAAELCDGLDNDCDGTVDPAGSLGGGPWYVDADADGYGDPDSVSEECDAPSGSVADGSDCDDGHEGIYPGAQESCGNGVDEDCDGMDAVCDVSLPGDGALSGVGRTLLGEIFAGDLGLRGAAGFSTALLGDLSGDGRGDLIVGAPLAGATSSGDADGIFYLVYGPLSADMNLEDADLIGEGGSGDWAGWALVGPGDLDGDGYADLLHGAVLADEGPGWQGTVEIIYGPLTGAIRYETWGAAPGTWNLGQSVASNGDVTGDGSTDIVVGAGVEAVAGGPGGGSYAGEVWIADYAAEGELIDEFGVRLDGANAGDVAGWSVAVVPDMTGDGVGEVGVGAMAAGGAAGLAAVVYGPITVDGSLDNADVQIAGGRGGDNLGVSMAGGDLNGDGYGDLLVGAPNADSASGVLYVWLGPIDPTATTADAWLTVTGDTQEYLGVSVDWGDVDGDGNQDIAVGAELMGAGEGGVRVYTDLAGGALGSGDAAAQWLGDVPGDAAGIVDIGPDMNADGVDDLLIGAPGFGAGRGAAFLVVGGS